MNVNIKTEKGLVKISPTSYNELTDRPIINDNNGTIVFIDNQSEENKIAQIDSYGVTSTEFIAGEHKLTEKADKSYVDNKLENIDLTGYAKTEDIPSLDGYATKEYVDSKLENTTSSNPSTNKYATKEELYQIALDAIESIPLKDNESSEFNIVDANGNIGLKLNSSGLYVKDVIADGHILSNKVDKEYVEQLVLDNAASTDDIDTLFENKNIN